MNITERTCANCAAFNPSATAEEEVCGNLTFITENPGTPQALNREPSPADYCDSHQTHEEDAAETHDIELALVRFRTRVRLTSLPPKPHSSLKSQSLASA